MSQLQDSIFQLRDSSMVMVMVGTINNLDTSGNQWDRNCSLNTINKNVNHVIFFYFLMYGFDICQWWMRAEYL